MFKRYAIALSVAGAALLLPTAGAAQAADTTTTVAAEGDGAPADPAAQPVRTPSGIHVVIGATGGTTRLSDPTDSSWGG
ncbi:hypothetical protein AB0P12_16890 [Streptomyces subrutilus]|uniref:hypothetical protein n=1 Tax=Streptomyces subrutilus TaxID=36818 RepID=UPI0034455038